MTKKFLLLLIAVFATVSVHALDASAAGNWSWGPPGFSTGWSAAARDNYLVTGGLADPLYNYYTPFWQSGSDPNTLGAGYDTGYRNTFSVNHDINANHGIPLLGYLDVVTPLFNTNELEIASTVAEVWSSIVDALGSLWDWVVGLFRNDYSNYDATGSYSDTGYQDNAFFAEFDYSTEP